jgi:hypothetical protein
MIQYELKGSRCGRSGRGMFDCNCSLKEADIHFVLRDGFQELGVGQTIGGGFLQPHTQGLA